MFFFSSSLEEEEEQEQTEEEEDESNLVFKSDHEFSPESDLENEDAEVQPTRRARTAQKGKPNFLVLWNHNVHHCHSNSFSSQLELSPS
jgi:hypothetical protein